MPNQPRQPESTPPIDPALLGEDVARTHRLATLGTLAASIAHEVNNILTPVLSYAQLALASPADAELTRKALQRAVDCTTKASRIGSAMLGFVRVGGDASEGQQAVVASVVGDAVLCLGRDLAKDGVALVVRVDPALRVAMDSVSLQQVVLNLLLNAREAMRGRGGDLLIDAERVAVSDSRSTWNIRLRVADSGRGMNSAALRKVFQPFVSSHTSSIPVRATNDSASAGRTGTGLGLTVCRMLIERAGGSIGVESVVDQGTVFTIVLPEAASDAGAIRVAAAA